MGKGGEKITEIKTKSKCSIQVANSDHPAVRLPPTPTSHPPHPPPDPTPHNRTPLSLAGRRIRSSAFSSSYP